MAVENPWYKEYGVMGAFVVVIVGTVLHSGNQATKGLATFRESTNTRLAVIESQVLALAQREIPPKEQKAHNDQNDMDIQKLNARLDMIESRYYASVQRFHAVIPKILDALGEREYAE